MKLKHWIVAVVKVALLVGLVGCASMPRHGQPKYQVGAGSAIYAGSSLPKAKTKVGVHLFFGQHIVESSGDGRGCCFSTGMAQNSGIPRGAVLATWSAFEYGDDKVYSEQFKTWHPKATEERYYYAVAQPSQLAPFPRKVSGHRYFGVYVSGGRVSVNERGLGSNQSVAESYISDDVRSNRFVFGRADTLYYKLLSHGSRSDSVSDDPSPWHEIRGVSITKDQYMELLKCSPGRSCRWLLSAGDGDLTPEQREYVLRNPVPPEDFKPLIKTLERSRRQTMRWQ